MATKSNIVVVIDTRERKPYRFARSEIKTLRSGDYSILGFENRIAIERKTKEDAYLSLGRERLRFEREFQRLSKLEYAAVVIESSLPDFLNAPFFSRMNSKAAIGSILSWSVKYRVFVFFAGDRSHGNAVTRLLLEKFHQYQNGAEDDQPHR